MNGFFPKISDLTTLQLGKGEYNSRIYKKCYGQYKTVWRTLITSCYKELIDSLTNG